MPSSSGGPPQRHQEGERPWTLSLTESLEPRFIQPVIQTLFPGDIGGDRSLMSSGQDSPDWRDDLTVNREELMGPARRCLKGNTAPGPDGFHKKIHALTLSILAGF
ncbi:hypothetical protein KM043_016495 [Ampulex compressa]|nr:hypothetical protein KM043_016495 [Ampulex compressa]